MRGVEDGAGVLVAIAASASGLNRSGTRARRFGDVVSSVCWEHGDDGQYASSALSGAQRPAVPGLAIFCTARVGKKVL